MFVFEGHAASSLGPLAHAHEAGEAHVQAERRGGVLGSCCARHLLLLAFCAHVRGRVHKRQVATALCRARGRRIGSAKRH